MSHQPIEDKHKTSIRKAGFTLVELLVVIAVISIIAAILFPVFARSRDKARQTVCVSNLRQIGMATMQYAQDNDGVLFCAVDHAYDDGRIIRWNGCWQARFKTFDTLHGPLSSYIHNAGIWFCPSAPALHLLGSSQSPIIPSYGLNELFAQFQVTQGHPASLAQVQVPAETILAADSAQYASWCTNFLCGDEYVYPPSGLGQSVQGRHSGRASVLWMDGHVSAEPPIAFAYPKQIGSSVDDLRAFQLGDILKESYTGNAQIDDYYYELTKS